MNEILRRDDFVTPGWVEELSDTWGATSLHAAVFRRPRGFKWVHCARCRLPAPPSSQWRFCPFTPSAAKIAERVEALTADCGLPGVALTLKRMTEILEREFLRTSLP